MVLLWERCARRVLIAHALGKIRQFYLAFAYPAGDNVSLQHRTFHFSGRHFCGEGVRKKTNAAWASHPSRIVIADVLNRCLSPRRKIIAQRRSEERHAAMTNLKLALQGYDSAFPSLFSEELLRRPLSPGTSALDMRQFFPR
jgi:hypothetical protein